MYKTCLFAIVFIPLAKVFLLLIYKTCAEKLLTALNTIFLILMFQTQYGRNGRKGCVARRVWGVPGLTRGCVSMATAKVPLK